MTRAVEADQRPVGLVVERAPGHAEHGQRVDDAGDHGEDQQDAQRGDVLPDERR